MFDQFAEELRSARLKKGISLEQIAAKTRIDIKFIEAIDTGNLSFLPELYVRAFLKQYAKTVGLDETETIQNYEDAKEGRLAEKDDSKSLLEQKIEIEKPHQEEIQEKPVRTYTDASVTKTVERGDDKKKIYRMVAYITGFVLLSVVVFFAFIKKSSTITVEEKPYEQVLKETQNRFEVEKQKDEQPAAQVNLDSMFLQIANVDSLDSAWVMVIYDDKVKEDFLLYPRRTKTVKAADNFQFTLGNSGVISLMLDNNVLQFEGRRGAVRHYLVNRKGLERLYSPPILKPEQNGIGSRENN
jgi:transcriptional regulator with XRE-family HTH domain